MDINPGQILSIALASLPTMLTVLIGILINNMDTRLDDMRTVLDARLKHLEER